MAPGMFLRALSRFVTNKASLDGIHLLVFELAADDLLPPQVVAHGAACRLQAIARWHG